MRSSANIKGHPLHPILVSFPIAFFVGAFISDVIQLVTDEVFYGQMAGYLEAGGIIAALVAAVPGVIDYFTVVPPNSSAMKRATRHGLLNISMVLVYAISMCMRWNNNVSVPVILLTEGIGLVMLTIAGWMGGTLVHRNQIGVDHRYAGAGKWKEETFTGTGRVELKGLDKMGVNQMMLLHVNDKRIVIGRTETEFVAFDDFCTHKGGTLADGAMICGTVQCPWHGSQFNTRTGEVKAGPAKEPIKTYKVEIGNQKYYLQF